MTQAWEETKPEWISNIQAKFWRPYAAEVSAGAMRKPGKSPRLGELNADLHSVSPSHAATAGGCVVKHKIEGIGNSDGIFHFEAGAPVRLVADSTN